ncbi:signal recognition particle-docking protein FtsY [Methylophilaceae bacterium]|nr:signal recognition particle-docking protein FtsY [Methylophilaceae bacterium]
MFDFLKKLVSKSKTTKKKVKPSVTPKKPKVNIVKKKVKPSVAPKKPKVNIVKKKVKPSVAPKKSQKEEKSFFSFTEKIKKGLTKTRENLSAQLTDLFKNKKIDEAFFEELEMILLTADVGIKATEMLIQQVRLKVKEDNIQDESKLKLILKNCLAEILITIESPLKITGNLPFVIMVVGVNGTGKTTTIGKLTKFLQDEGKTVLIAAGDTFRAAAVEQLSVWGKRNDVDVISHATADPSSVIFDAVNSAKAKNIDVVIADTAGRLPTQKNLIDEITKIKRVISKCHAEGPQEILLVLDANTGQNAITQLKTFDEALGVTGLIMTKLDGTAKGGVLAAIAKEIPTPIRFIGVGEGIDDLKVFAAKEYAEGMFE